MVTRKTVSIIIIVSMVLLAKRYFTWEDNSGKINWLISCTSRTTAKNPCGGLFSWGRKGKQWSKKKRIPIKPVE